VSNFFQKKQNKTLIEQKLLYSSDLRGTPCIYTNSYIYTNIGTARTLQAITFLYSDDTPSENKYKSLSRYYYT